MSDTHRAQKLVFTGKTCFLVGGSALAYTYNPRAFCLLKRGLNKVNNRPRGRASNQFTEREQEKTVENKRVRRLEGAS